MRLLVCAIVTAALAAPASAVAWSWPVGGPVLRHFSFGADPYAAGQHRGIDIGAPTGARVIAPAAGTVSFAGSVPRGGKTVTLQTQDGYAVTLVHLGSYSVGRGDAVAEGDAVGTVGPSGVTELAVPYVYLGIRVSAEAQGYRDPLLFLPPRDASPLLPPSDASPPEAPATAPAAAPPASAPGSTAPAAAAPPGAPLPVVAPAATASAGQASAASDAIDVTSGVAESASSASGAARATESRMRRPNRATDAPRVASRTRPAAALNRANGRPGAVASLRARTSRALRAGSIAAPSAGKAVGRSSARLARTPRRQSTLEHGRGLGADARARGRPRGESGGGASRLLDLIALAAGVLVAALVAAPVRRCAAAAGASRSPFV